MASAISRFFRYVFNKRKELDRLNFNDVLLTKLILDIHRKKTVSRFENVGLYSLEPVHPVDREGAIASVKERAEVLTGRREEILRSKLVDRGFLAKHLPSISWIKAVRANDERYVSFEGNGRIAALKKVFNREDRIDVEVEVYHFRNAAKILRRIDRVRRHYGVI